MDLELFSFNVGKKIWFKHLVDTMFPVSDLLLKPFHVGWLGERYGMVLNVSLEP